MISWIRRVAFVLLAALTAVYLYRFVTGEGVAALSAWHGRWHIIGACLLLNWTGITLDLFCWAWMYRRCHVAVRGVTGGAIFLSVFAAQLLPMQTGRLVRPDAAHRLGFGSLRNGIEAETALIYLDLAGVAALVALLAMWTLSPLAAPLAAAAVAGLALGMATAGTRLFGGLFTALRPALFWSLPGLCTLLLRMADRALLGGVLFLLVRPDAPESSYINAALYVMAADSLGAASGMPGGLGVAEPVLGWLLSLAELPEAQIVIAVALYRVVTYWSQLPLAWLALLYVEFIKPAPENDPSQEYAE